MSKYHLGDKFIVEVKEVLESNNGTLYRSNFSTLAFDDYGLDNLQKYDEIGHKLELIDELKQAEYNRGLADAWELVKKIQLQPNDGGLSNTELLEIFGVAFIDTIFKKNTYEEALAKIEAYHEKKKEIKVGDVVEGLSGYKAVVTVISMDRIQVMFDDGSHTEWNLKEINNTGKHIDIEGLLKQIGV